MGMDKIRLQPNKKNSVTPMYPGSLSEAGSGGRHRFIARKASRRARPAVRGTLCARS